jgi:hypothetical protein
MDRHHLPSAGGRSGYPAIWHAIQNKWRWSPFRWCYGFECVTCRWWKFFWLYCNNFSFTASITSGDVLQKSACWRQTCYSARCESIWKHILTLGTRRVQCSTARPCQFSSYYCQFNVKFRRRNCPSTRHASPANAIDSGNDIFNGRWFSVNMTG